MTKIILYTAKQQVSLKTRRMTIKIIQELIVSDMHIIIKILQEENDKLNIQDKIQLCNWKEAEGLTMLFTSSSFLEAIRNIENVSINY